MRLNKDVIDIIEDRQAYECGVRLIIYAAETGKLPPYESLPRFNDSLVEEDIVHALELITGKKYG